MYVYVLEHLVSHRKDYPGAFVDVATSIIKGIIDEGHGHWARFTLVKETLAGIEEKDYLRQAERGPAR